MLLNNKVPIKNIIYPVILEEKLQFAATVSLRHDDILLFNKALELVARSLISDTANKKLSANICDLRRVLIIFTENGELSFSEFEKEIGIHLSMIIYKMKPLHYIDNQRFTLFTFIEELTHHFWGIEDETLVKYKVVEIMKPFDKDITIDIVKGWGVNGL